MAAASKSRCVFRVQDLNDTMGATTSAHTLKTLKGYSLQTSSQGLFAFSDLHLWQDTHRWENNGMSSGKHGRAFHSLSHTNTRNLFFLKARVKLTWRAMVWETAWVVYIFLHLSCTVHFFVLFLFDHLHLLCLFYLMDFGELNTEWDMGGIFCWFCTRLLGGQYLLRTGCSSFSLFSFVFQIS